MKNIIERGASWSLEETKLLLALWGQDYIERKATKAKRTKEVYDNIAAKFNQSGYERTAEQVRTRMFNMIAEYRRILKDPNMDRRRKCLFFDHLDKIYQAETFDDLKSALDAYDEPECPESPALDAANANATADADEANSDAEAVIGHEANNDQSATTTSTTSHSGKDAPAGKATNHSSTNNNNNNNNINANNNNSGSTNNNISANTTNSSSSTTTKNMTTSTTNNSNNGISIGHELAEDDSTESGGPSSKKPKLESSKAASDHSTGGLGAATQQQSATYIITSSNNSLNDNKNQQQSNNKHHQSLLLPNAAGASTPSTPVHQTGGSNGASSNNNPTASYINLNNTKLPIIRTNQLNGTATRLPTTATLTGHHPQLYQAPVNTFDVTSSALLIDRTFAHLSRESENMREWIAIEKERLSLERARRQQDAEREARRERVLTETLMKFQQQWLDFISQLDPRIVENCKSSIPTLKIPTTDTSSGTTTTTTTSAVGTQAASTTNNTSAALSSTTTTTTTTTPISTSSESTLANK